MPTTRPGRGVVQPALGGHVSWGRGAGPAPREDAQPQRVLGAAHELWARDPRPVHTVGLVPVQPATTGISAARCASGWERLPAAPPRGRTAARGGFVSPRRWPTGRRPRGGPLPRHEEDEAGARHRLAFEELFLLQVAVAGRAVAGAGGRRAATRCGRWASSSTLVAGACRSSSPAISGPRAHASMPTSPARPMQRLLMGEVGSGKAQPLNAPRTDTYGLPTHGTDRGRG